MARRIQAETEVVVTLKRSTFRGVVEAAKRVGNEWKYLVSTHPEDRSGHAMAGWYHEDFVEVNGQTSLNT